MVCARSGSSGFQHKNLLTLDGEKLIERAIRLAWEGGCDDVLVSTDYLPGVDFDIGMASLVKRPLHLRGGTVAKLDVWKHMASLTDAERFVDIDVTRPLHEAETVRRVVDALDSYAAVTALAPSHLHPAFDIMGPDGIPYDVRRQFDARQQLDPTYVSVGVWGFRRDELMARSFMYDGVLTPVMAESRTEALDINDELDWMILTAVHRARR